jgi:hypothetical protein
MPRNILRILVFLALMLLPLSARAQEIVGPDVKINEGHIVASTTLKLSENHLEDISKGISKEIDISLDLFRVWNSWPDEFVVGAKFTRTLSCDPMKKEFVATSLYEYTLREKRFSDCESLLEWALTVKDVTLASVTDVEPGKYFVKVRAEGRIRKLPPVVGYLFFFVKEKDFKLKTKSAPFTVSEPGAEEHK